MTPFNVQFTYEILDKTASQLETIKKNILATNTAIRRSFTNTQRVHESLKKNFQTNQAAIRRTFTNTSSTVKKNLGEIANEAKMANLHLSSVGRGLDGRVLKTRNSLYDYSFSMDRGLSKADKAIYNHKKNLGELRAEMYASRNMLFMGALPIGYGAFKILQAERQKYESISKMAVFLDKPQYRKDVFGEAPVPEGIAERMIANRRRAEEIAKEIRDFSVERAIPIEAMQDSLDRLIHVSPIGLEDQGEYMGVMGLAKEFASFGKGIGLGAMDIKNSFRAITQIYGKNKLTAEELNRQLADVAPALKQMIIDTAIKHSGGVITKENFYKMMEAGKIGPGVINLVAHEMKRVNVQLLREQQKHWSFWFDQLSRKLKIAIEDFGAFAAESLQLRIVFRSLSYIIQAVIDGFRNLPDWMKTALSIGFKGLFLLFSAGVSVLFYRLLRSMSGQVRAMMERTKFGKWVKDNSKSKRTPYGHPAKKANPVAKALSTTGKFLGRGGFLTALFAGSYFVGRKFFNDIRIEKERLFRERIMKEDKMMRTRFEMMRIKKYLNQSTQQPLLESGIFLNNTPFNNQTPIPKQEVEIKIKNESDNPVEAIKKDGLNTSFNFISPFNQSFTIA